MEKLKIAIGMDGEEHSAQSRGDGEQAATAEGGHGTGGGAAAEPERPAPGGRAGVCFVQLPPHVYRALSGERGQRATGLVRPPARAWDLVGSGTLPP